MEAAAGGARRITGLDGLRALSIALVLLGHLSGTRGYPRVPWWLRPVGVNGALGVAVFFAISGFLITTLLVRECDARGTVDLKQFFARRALRIAPAFYAYLLVVGALWLAGAATLGRWELLSAATYTRNFYRDGGWLTGHAWSLAIEEQFYLLWPVVLALGGRAAARRVAAAVVVLAPFVRLATFVLVPRARDMIDWYTFTRLDSIMAGCLLALVRHTPWFAAATRVFFARGGALACVGAVLASSYLRLAFRPWDAIAAYSVEAVAVALGVEWCVTHPRTRVGRALEWRPVRWVGVLSYSLYLWQELFLNRQSSSVLCRFPLNLACAFGAAVLSQRLIERPFLRLKDAVGTPAATPAVVAARPSRPGAAG